MFIFLYLYNVMIKIKIQGKNCKIKTANELTVSEFIKISKIKNPSLINYLSVVLNKSWKETAKFKIKNISSLENRIGVIRNDYHTIKPDKKLIFDNKIYNINDLEIETLGQRQIIQDNFNKVAEKSFEEYLCYVLAVSLDKYNFNTKKIEEIKGKLMNENYIKILPTAFFLLKNSGNGKKKGMKFLTIFLDLIKIYRLKNKPE